MFETIYRWSISLFGSNLAEHLSGWDEAKGDYTKLNLFLIIGIIALASAVFVCLTYYYFYNHPRQNHWNKWLLLWLLPVAVINLFVASGITYYDVMNDYISSDLLPVYWYNCLGFGLTNFIVSAGWFVIISLIIKMVGVIVPKWSSRNCKYSPF
jgi:hypothetical protein